MSNPLQPRGEQPSASAAARLLNCAASHRMGLLAHDMHQAAGQDDQWAAYGTAVHEAVFKESPEGLPDDQARQDYSKTMRKMREFLASWGATNEDLIMREERLWLHDGLFPIFSGMADYIRIQPKNARAAIMDVKTLWARAQDPRENDQLWSLGVLLMENFPEIERVTLQIISPKYHYQSQLVNRSELEEYGAKLRLAIHAANGISIPIPGDWCKHCHGLLICPKVKREASQYIVKTELPYALPLGDKGAKLLSELERIKKFVTEAEKFYKLSLAREPDAVPGWILEPGDEVRSFVSSPDVIKEKVVPLIGENAFWNSVTVGIGALEKNWKPVKPDQEIDKMDEVLKDSIIRKRNAPGLKKVRKIKEKTP